MTKIFTCNFADGESEIKVGQVCFADNAQTGYHRKLLPYTVEKIGPKYVTMTNGFKFSLEEGRLHGRNFCWGRLYSSEAVFRLKEEREAMIRKVQRMLHETKLTFELATAIHKILVGEIYVTERIADISDYNHNFYKLSSEYENCNVVYEACDELSETYTYEFGVITNGKFTKVLENHYIIIQHNISLSSDFTDGKLSVEELKKTNFSDHYFY